MDTYLLLRRGSLVGLLAAVLALGPAPAQADDPPMLTIDFAEAATGTTLHTPVLGGSSAGQLSSQIVTEGGGAGVVADSVAPAGDGRSLRLPAFTPLRRPHTPLAVLRVRNSTGADALAVGSQDFAWAADFRLDENLGSSSSDGDNLFQRGLWGQPAQWKLSLDARKAQCLVGFGSRQVSTPVVHISDDRWHRATCRRTATSSTRAELSLRVERWNGTSFVAYRTVRSTGNAAGSLTFNRTTPVSVGGKLNNSGSLHPAPDQFNGRVDRVRLWVG